LWLAWKHAQSCAITATDMAGVEVVRGRIGITMTAASEDRRLSETQGATKGHGSFGGVKEL